MTNIRKTGAITLIFVIELPGFIKWGTDLKSSVPLFTLSVDIQDIRFQITPLPKRKGLRSRNSRRNPAGSREACQQTD